MALRCRTRTPRRAIIWAPRARLTLRIAGNSSGLSPTASATAKSSVSTGGRPRNMCAAKTRSTMINIALVSRYPKRRIPRSNSVSGGRSVSRCAMAPNSVAGPVATTRHRAMPLRTLVPRNTQFVRAPSPRGLIDRSWLLLDGKALAGQHRFAHEEVRGLEDDRISRHKTAGREKHDIAGHHLLRWYRLGVPIAQHAGPHMQAGAQRPGDRLRAVLPGVPNAHGRHDDRHDDRRIEPLARHGGGACGEHQEEQERAAQLANEHVQSRRCASLPKFVGTVDPRRRWAASAPDNPSRSGAESPCELRGIDRPVRGDRRPLRLTRARRDRATGEPIARQHREPEAETAKQQRGGQRHRRCRRRPSATSAPTSPRTCRGRPVRSPSSETGWRS